ncbi:MAG: hypothetical protein HYW48_01550 [Deltaproteobacteria bacterium]|nr:hypothetical protein [Deltaproteobacteria bacterium]
MEEPAAQFPPNHLLAQRSQLRSFLQTTSLPIIKIKFSSFVKSIRT